MMAELSKRLWQRYPKCRLQIEAEQAGLNSYHITVSLSDADGEILKRKEHYCTGTLLELKRETVASFIESLLGAATA